MSILGAASGVCSRIGSIAMSVAFIGVRPGVNAFEGVENEGVVSSRISASDSPASSATEMESFRSCAWSEAARVLLVSKVMKNEAVRILEVKVIRQSKATDCAQCLRVRASDPIPVG